MLNLKALDSLTQQQIQHNEQIVAQAHKAGSSVVDDMLRVSKRDIRTILPLYADGKDIQDKVKIVIDKHKEKYTKEIISKTTPYFWEMIKSYKEIYENLTDLLAINPQDPTDDDFNDSFNMFVFGYISNIEGLMYNTARGLLEGVDDVLATGQTIDSINDFLDEFSFNPNIFSLAQTTHLRAIYRYQMWRDFSKILNYWRLDIDERKIDNLSKEGNVMRNLLFIHTIEEWARKQGKGKQPVNGLGLHHNSNEYYTPIPNSEYKQAISWSKKRRKSMALSANADKV